MFETDIKRDNRKGTYSLYRAGLYYLVASILLRQYSTYYLDRFWKEPYLLYISSFDKENYIADYSFK
jgi:hypothetical protein